MSYGLFGADGNNGVWAQARKWVREANSVGVVQRAFDTKPIWAQINISERCNLDCGYCIEHVKRGQHVPFEVVKGHIHHAHRLGVKHLEFIGGEPLLHPDLPAMVAEAKKLGMGAGMTTNGFLVGRKHDVDDLIDCGLSRLQLSIDRLEPNETTQKALSLIEPVLLTLREAPLWFRVNAVIVESTIDESKALAERLFALRVPVAFSPGHTNGRLEIREPARFQEVFRWLRNKKVEGAPVDIPWFLFDYYEDVFSGAPLRWSCEGGAKAFYVDTKGQMRYCSQTAPRMPFREVQPDDLRSNHRCEKGCELGCGVQCMLITSLPFNRLDYVLAAEALPEALHQWTRRRRAADVPAVPIRNDALPVLSLNALEREED